MKIQCERDKLLHAFQMAASVAPARSPKPILQNVKLEVTRRTRRILMATDLEVGIRIEVPGIHVEAPGSVVLADRDRFGSILRESSDEKLDCRERRPQDRVRGERSEFQLPSENPDEFPAVAGFDEAEVPRAAGPVLPRADPPHGLRHRQREQPLCPGRRAARTGAGQQLTAVGTDGRRLARMEGPAKSVGGHVTGRQHDDRPHPGDATDRAGPGRRRREDPDCRPRQRRARPERPGDDLLAAGRRPLPEVARRVSAPRGHAARSS